MLTKEDFIPTDEELEKINKVISEGAARFAAADEVPDGATVIFTFTPLGRDIETSFS